MPSAGLHYNLRSLNLFSAPPTFLFFLLIRHWSMMLYVACTCCVSRLTEFYLCFSLFKRFFKFVCMRVCVHRDVSSSYMGTGTEPRFSTLNKPSLQPLFFFSSFLTIGMLLLFLSCWINVKLNFLLSQEQYERNIHAGTEVCLELIDIFFIEKEHVSPFIKIKLVLGGGGTRL